MIPSLAKTMKKISNFFLPMKFYLKYEIWQRQVILDIINHLPATEPAARARELDGKMPMTQHLVLVL